MKNRYIIILTALLLIGCIKESYENCPNSTSISYYYTLHNEGGNLFEDSINHLKLYVFDSNDRFYKSIEVADPEQLTNSHSIDLNLAQGSWQVMALGGDLHSFNVQNLETTSKTLTENLVAGVSKIEDFEFGLKGIEEHNSEVSGDLKGLFYGKKTSIEVNSGRQSIAYTAPMTNNVKNIIVNISGVPAATTKSEDSNSGVSVYASIGNSSLDQDNSIHPNAKTTLHSASMSQNNDTLTTNFDILRLHTDNQDAKLVVKSQYLPNQDSISIPLVSSIMQNPQYQTQEDLDRENQFEFNLDLSKDISNQTVVTIKINDWRIINITPMQ